MFTRSLSVFAVAVVWCVPVFGQDATGDDERMIDALIEILGDRAETTATRRHACQKLMPFKARAKKAVPVVVKILEDKQSADGLKNESTYLLGAIGKDAAPAIPVLAKRFAEDYFSSELTATVLIQVGADKKTMMPLLVKHLEYGPRGGFLTVSANSISRTKGYEPERVYLEATLRSGDVDRWALDYVVELIAQHADADAASAVTPLHDYLRAGIAHDKGADSMNFLRNPKDLLPKQIKIRLLAVEALRKVGNTNAEKVLRRVSLADDMAEPVKKAAEEALKSLDQKK